MKNMDPKFPFNPSAANSFSPKKMENKKEKYPRYEEKFGHLAEKIIRSALANRRYAIEKVEKGTDYEDYHEKVDFWLQLKNLTEPFGIQFTTNPKKYQEKKDFLRKRNFLAHKKKKPDSEIDWEGNANVVVILGNHAKMLEYWKKIELEGAKPEDIVSDAFIVDFFKQVLIEMGKANPSKRIIIMELFKNLAKDLLKSKRAEN